MCSTDQDLVIEDKGWYAAKPERPSTLSIRTHIVRERVARERLTALRRIEPDFDGQPHKRIAVAEVNALCSTMDIGYR